MAFGIPFDLVENDGVPRIGLSIAFKEAEQTRGPVVVLVGDEDTTASAARERTAMMHTADLLKVFAASTGAMRL